jgi:hypothetical protein
MAGHRHVLALLGVLAAGSAHADGASLVDAAGRAVRELRYEDAQLLADKAVQRGNLDREELIALYALRGQLAAIAEGAGPGEAEFRRLLVLDPDHPLPRDTPVVAGPFKEARRWVAAHGHLTVEARASELRPNLPTRVALAVLVDPLAMIERARLCYRLDGDEPFTCGAAAIRPSLPPLSAGSGLDYYVEVLDATDDVLDRLGTSGGPLRLEMPPPVVTTIESPPPRPDLPPPETIAERPRLALAASTRPVERRASGWAAGGVLGGLGLASLAAALAVDITGRHSYDALLQSCAPNCSAGSVDRLHQQEAAAIGLYVAAGVTLVAATVVLAVQIARRGRAR